MVRIPDGAGIQEALTANGLVASTATLMYAAPSLTQVTINTLICCNTNATNINTVKLHLKPDGGTLRQFVSEALDPGHRLEGRGEPMELNESDELHGEATNANEVTWFISGKKETSIG